VAWTNLRDDLEEEFSSLVRFDQKYEGLRGWRRGGLTQGHTDESKAEMKRRHQREHMERQYSAGLPKGGKGGRANKLALTPEVIELVKKSTSAVELAIQLGRSRALAFRLRALFRG
jgi:hypothetical protein